MWKTLGGFTAQISRFQNILPLSTAQINCSGSDLSFFRKPYVEIKLVNAKDLRILRYYLQEVVSPRLADHQPIFNDFIEEFGYEGVFRLCKKLRVSR
jgi:hypothetical protein